MTEAVHIDLHFVPVVQIDGGRSQILEPRGPAWERVKGILLEQIVQALSEHADGTREEYLAQAEAVIALLLEGKEPEDGREGSANQSTG